MCMQALASDAKQGKPNSVYEKKKKKKKGKKTTLVGVGRVRISTWTLR